MEYNLEQKEAIRNGFIKELGTTEFAVWSVIQAFTNIEGVAFPSQKTIAELSGVSTSTVKRTVKKLVDLHLIETETIRKGQTTKTIYTVQNKNEGRKYTASSFIKEFSSRYAERYGVYYTPNWGKDGGLVKTKLINNYTDEQLDAILNITFEQYDKRWATKQYPRPTIGAICTFIANQSLTIWQEEQNKAIRIKQAQEEDLSKYFRQQF